MAPCLHWAAAYKCAISPAGRLGSSGAATAVATATAATATRARRAASTAASASASASAVFIFLTWAGAALAMSSRRKNVHCVRRLLRAAAARRERRPHGHPFLSGARRARGAETRVGRGQGKMNKENECYAGCRAQWGITNRLGGASIGIITKKITSRNCSAHREEYPRIREFARLRAPPCAPTWPGVSS